MENQLRGAYCRDVLRECISEDWGGGFVARVCCRVLFAYISCKTLLWEVSSERTCWLLAEVDCWRFIIDIYWGSSLRRGFCVFTAKVRCGGSLRNSIADTYCLDLLWEFTTETICAVFLKVCNGGFSWGHRERTRAT